MATVLDTFVTNLRFTSDVKGLDAAESRLQGFKRTLGSMAQGLTVASAALTGVGFVAGRTILSFETSMNNLQATLKPTADEMARLRGQAEELGRTTAFSASQTADAQTQLAQAGFSATQVLGAMPDVLNLAAAGQLSMGEAAALTSIQLNAFNLDVSQSQRITDVLARTATSTQTTVSQLGPAFRQVAATAQGLGSSIEETAAMIGVLRNNGLQAEQAGTGLRNVLARLVDPSGEAEQAIRDLGLDVNQLKRLIESGGVLQVLEMLGQSGLGVAEAQKLFGLEAGNAGRILAENVGQVWALTQSLEAAQGAATEMATTQMQGLPGAMLEFKSASEGLQLQLGTSGLTGILERVTDMLRSFASWLTNTSVVLQQAVIVTGSAIVALGALMLAIRAVSFIFGPFIGAIKASVLWLINKDNVLRRRLIPSLISFAKTLWTQILPAIGRFIASMWGALLATLRFALTAIAAAIAGVIGFAATIWAAAIPALAAFIASVIALSVALLTNPITWIILGIVALGAALIALVVHWDAVKRVVMDFWDKWGGWISGALAVVMPFIGIPLLIARNWDSLRKFFSDLWDWIVAKIQTAVDSIMTIIKPVTSAIGAIGNLFGAQTASLNVSPAGQLATEFAGGLAQGPALLPVAPPAAVANQYSSSTSNRTTSVGKVETHNTFTINSQSGDPNEIARKVQEALNDQFTSVAHDFDSNVRE